MEFEIASTADNEWYVLLFSEDGTPIGDEAFKTKVEAEAFVTFYKSIEKYL